ncbi:MAG: isochorismatase family protein [Chloroflexota bacterium]|nr:MAG: isochorismatase family protein [Chloroflexota bacterium]
MGVKAALRIPIRYLAMHSTDLADNVEAGIWPVEETYEIDPATVALVLVDTWNRHNILSHEQSTARIMRERIAPLLPAMRAAGIPVIHAPSPNIARIYPQWQRRFGARWSRTNIALPEWPPSALRQRQGEYAKYARLPAETWTGWDGVDRWNAIHDSIAPEPDDHVVATGDELHELLAERRVLFSIYAGFATNICVLHRDYGILAIGARGYLPILLRDCTLGIETRDTLDGLLTTRLAIHDVERRYYSADSADLIAACQAIHHTDA